MNLSASSFAPLGIDPDAIRRFVEVVFGGLAGFVDVRLLADKGAPDQPPVCRGHQVGDDLAIVLAAWAKDALTMRRACFVVPATVQKRTRAKMGNVAATAVILVDLDDGDIEAKRAHLEEHLGPPTLAVASGGITDAGKAKLHLYWRLDEPVHGADLGRVRSVREVLARKVGGDLALAGVQQPIRLPGSVHRKFEWAAQVRIVADTRATYPLDMLERSVAAMPALEDVDPLEAGATRRMLKRTRAGGLDGTTRYEALSHVIGQQLARARLGRITREMAWQGVARFNDACIEPPWEEARLRREFERLELVDRRNHGPSSNRDFDRTEHGLARLLADRHADRWRFVRGRGWLAWNGARWENDAADRILEACRRLCEEAAEGETSADCRRLLTDRTIRAVERLARYDPRLAASAGDWDADPWLLNTPQGNIDLRTGEVLRADANLHMTLLTNASPGSECPGWLAFIARVTGGDAEMSTYLQRVAGYCLTARTDEQVFFFLHGPGANGKTVFLEVLSHVLGRYARTAPLDTFMATRADRQQNDLASLANARMVIATEVEVSRPWAEARIKAVTGGDRITVRLLYGEFFETVPGYKLLVAGNHRPRLVGGGLSMARRLHLIPFDVVIPEEERDGRLREKLLAERDGILGWMIEGCIAWQRMGLLPPRKVRDAVAGYFDAEDFVADWIGEDCEVGPSFTSSTAELYASWRKRAESLGITPGNARDLGERLRALGYEPVRTSRARGWKGIRLRAIDVMKVVE